MCCLVCFWFCEKKKKRKKKENVNVDPGVLEVEEREVNSEEPVSPSFANHFCKLSNMKDAFFGRTEGLTVPCTSKNLYENPI